MLWKRAVKDPDKKRIFTMVHAEKLSFRTCNKALQDLDVAAQGCNGKKMSCLPAIIAAKDILHTCMNDPLDSNHQSGIYEKWNPKHANNQMK